MRIQDNIWIQKPCAHFKITAIVIADNASISSSTCSDHLVIADNDNLLDSCTDCGDVARDDIEDQIRRSRKLLHTKNFLRT